VSRALTAEHFTRHGFQYGTECVGETAAELLSPAGVCQVAKRLNAILARARRERGEQETVEVVTARARMSEPPRDRPRAVWLKESWGDVRVPADVTRAAVLELADERASIVAGRVGCSVSFVNQVRREAVQRAAESAYSDGVNGLDAGVGCHETAKPPSASSGAICGDLRTVA
jgi:hypothetical protein